MTVSLEKQKKSSYKTDGTMKRIIQAFKPYKWRVIMMFIAILLTTLLSLVNPLLIQRVFDDAILKRNLRLLFIYIAIMLIAPIIAGFIGVCQAYLNSELGQNVMRDLRSRLYAHLQSMSLHFFTSTRAGEIQSRLSNDVGGIQDTVTFIAASVLTNFSVAVSSIIAMFILSPLLAAISLAALPLFLWITYKVGNVHRATSKERQKSMAAVATVMQETLSVSGILLVKTFGTQLYTQQQFEKENQKLTRLGIRQQMIGRWFMMLTNVFFAILPAIIYLVAGLQYITHEQITFGTIAAFTTLQSRFFPPVGQLLNTQVDIQGTLALFDRIFEYLDLPIDIQDTPNALQLRPEEICGHISFKDVTFTYKRHMQKTARQTDQIQAQRAQSSISRQLDELSESPRPTLNHISFDVQPGQLVALVGPSGAGKTTITYMVPRLYDIDSGTIEIDGHNVQDIALNSLSQIIGMVTQETYLFHTSIRKNLLYGCPNVTDEEMIAATKAAAIHDRIMELEESYETVVGERGYKLSGGEKQRLAIARVLLKNPRILILDEATSALDSHSERLIQTALESVMKGRTTLAIAHRLSTILAADVILVVNEGQIVERGTHQELLRQGGLYTRLYQEQFS